MQPQNKKQKWIDLNRSTGAFGGKRKTIEAVEMHQLFVYDRFTFHFKFIIGTFSRYKFVILKVGHFITLNYTLL
jgi:hypothetical protein